MIFDPKIIAQSICNQTTELDIIDKLDAKAERMLLDKKIWKQIMVDDPTKNLKKLMLQWKIQIQLRSSQPQ
jgi:hypothetical protein